MAETPSEMTSLCERTCFRWLTFHKWVQLWTLLLFVFGAFLLLFIAALIMFIATGGAR
jgi:hypothetical protein